VTKAPKNKSDAKPGAPRRRSAPENTSTLPHDDAATIAPRAGGARGTRASVRVYRQGLGDCILLRVKRDNGDDFKLMIDCGLVLGAKDAAAKMQHVVDDIVKDTDGKVDVLAITHEHWDHLSGFNQAETSFQKLAADKVWVAWTEDDKDDLANQLRNERKTAEKALAACANHLRASGNDNTSEMLESIAVLEFGAAKAAGSVGDAFDKAKAKAKHPGDLKTWLPTEAPYPIPGANARIYFLGPPHDRKLIRKINPSTRSPETYGLAMSGDGALPLGVIATLKGVAEELGVNPEDAAPFHRRVTILCSSQKELEALPQELAPLLRPGEINPGNHVRDFFVENYFRPDNDWRRIDGDWLGSAAELALALQSYTNNTSLVMAVELGKVGEGDVLLFAADAQVGNWESWQNLQWEVDKVKVTGPDLLKRTIFYKVGHHGSHNATLRDNGLELMTALKTAIIPVNHDEAVLKHWGKMPLEALTKALEQKVGNAKRSIRTDEPPSDPPPDIKVTDGYVEVAI